MMLLRLARLFFIALLALVTYLTVTPDPGSGGGASLTKWIAAFLLGDPSFSDKIGHFLAYGALGVVGVAARITPWRRYAGLAILLALYGALLELVQGLTAKRSAEWADAFANAGGAVMGVVGGLLVWTLAQHLLHRGARSSR